MEKAAQQGRLEWAVNADLGFTVKKTAKQDPKASIACCLAGLRQLSLGALEQVARPTEASIILLQFAMPLKKISVELGLPYIGKISGDWEPDQKERQAAWELYVELITRVSVINLGPNEGLLREALSSLFSLFSTTREILRKYGPAVAKPKVEGGISFGRLSVAVLNAVLRPVLSKWHPILEDYESRKPSGMSPLEYERNWEKATELRGALEEARLMLVEFAGILADVAGVPSLLPDVPGSDK